MIPKDWCLVFNRNDADDKKLRTYNVYVEQL